MVKKLSRALAALGGIIVLTGIIGRFYGAPTVMGHTTTSMLMIVDVHLVGVQHRCTPTRCTLWFAEVLN